jgi:hypothetical protein
VDHAAFLSDLANAASASNTLNVLLRLREFRFELVNPGLIDSPVELKQRLAPHVLGRSIPLFRGIYPDRDLYANERHKSRDCGIRARPRRGGTFTCVWQEQSLNCSAEKWL